MRTSAAATAPLAVPCPPDSAGTLAYCDRPIRATTLTAVPPRVPRTRANSLPAADPDETLTGAVVDHMGADHFVWASDYPHVDADFGVVAEIRNHLAGLSREQQRKVLGENALRFYDLPAPPRRAANRPGA